MKLIDVSTRKSPNTFAMVDDNDYEWLAAIKWSVEKDRRTKYATRQAPKRIWMHRIVMGVQDPKIQVDHIDGDGLNNQRNNLRLATNAQNSANRRNYRAKYKGVSREYGRWTARICVNYKCIRLGSFDTMELAAIAYDVAAVKHFREFAALNFPVSETNRNNPIPSNSHDTSPKGLTP